MQLTKKLLTPSKFNLSTMKPMTSGAIVKAVNNRIKGLNVSPAVKEAMQDMVTKSVKGKPTFDASFYGLSGAEIGILTSDFGEVTGALYMLNSGMGYTAAKFPISESQRLVDYYLVRDEVDEPYSAKAGQGGAPSITAVESALNDMDQRKLNKNHKKAIEAIQIINKNSIFEGVLIAADYLDLPGYKQLIKTLKRKDLKTGYSSGIPKLQHLEKAIDSCGSYNACLNEVAPLFKAANFELGGDRGAEKMKSVFAGTAGSRYKKWGLLHFPITSEVMSWLNDPSNGATEVLTLAARTLSVNQIYLDHVPEVTGQNKWKSGQLKYVLKNFSDSHFKFHSPSSTPNPVGNRIGMKMIKR